MPVTGDFKYDPDKLAIALEDYILTAKPYPILAEFVLQQNIPYREYFYAIAEREKKNGNLSLHYAIKRCHIAKEVAVERLCSSGVIPTSFGIFTLKQLGWKDNVDEKNEEDVNIKKYEIVHIAKKEINAKA